jgi:hypothetical protein
MFGIGKPPCLPIPLFGWSVASAQGSPWAYDNLVPIVFVGPGINPNRIARKVHTVDMATTIAAFLGTRSTSGAVSSPLVEVY